MTDASPDASRVETVAVLGAASGIAREVAHVLARRGCRLILAARDVDKLETIANDLRLRHEATVQTLPFDAARFEEHAAMVRGLTELADGRLDGVVLAFGVMDTQETIDQNPDQARVTFDVNLTAPASLLLRLGDAMAKQVERGLTTPGRPPYLAVISSVAGDRGRQSNFTYGASKAGLSAFADGLRNRLYRQGVHVITIKPGQVLTPMSEPFVKAGSPLVASPQVAAACIDRAIRRRRDVAYVPGFWRLIMVVIRSIPERLFKRLRL